MSEAKENRCPFVVTGELNGNVTETFYINTSFSSVVVSFGGVDIAIWMKEISLRTRLSHSSLQILTDKNAARLLVSNPSDDVIRITGIGNGQNAMSHTFHLLGRTYICKAFLTESKEFWYITFRPGSVDIETSSLERLSWSDFIGPNGLVRSDIML